MRIKQSFQERIHKLDKTDKIVLAVLAVVFTCIYLAGGAKTFSDTGGYRDMLSTRDPGYALLLAFFRMLFGLNASYEIVAVLQNIATVVCLFLLIRFIKNTFRLQRIFTGMITVCMLLPFVITPFFASSGMIISNAILTEGVTYPFYYLYFYFMLRAVYEKGSSGRMGMMGSLVISFILSLVRGQMVILLLGWLVVMAVLAVSRGKGRKPFFILKNLLLIFVIGAGLIFAKGHLVKLYHYCVNGAYVGTVYGPETMLPFVAFTAEEGDEILVAEEKGQAVMADLYAAMKEEGWTKENYGNSLFDRAAALEATHDDVGNVYKNLTAPSSLLHEQIECDRLANVIMSGLLTKHLGEWIYNYIGLCMVGLIRTVSFLHPILNWYALAVYVTAAAAMWYLWYTERKQRKSSLKDAGDNRISEGTGQQDTIPTALPFMLVTALMTAAFVSATGMVIMCLSRYMIYNMPLIYIGMLLMLLEIIRKGKGTTGFAIT